MNENERRDLMLEMEELAEVEGFRNFAKLGTEFSVSSEIVLKLDSKAEQFDWRGIIHINLGGW
jgi:hypothetical protein